MRVCSAHPLSSSRPLSLFLPRGVCLGLCVAAVLVRVCVRVCGWVQAGPTFGLAIYESLSLDSVCLAQPLVSILTIETL